MTKQPGFFDADDRLRALSAAGDPLERLRAVVDFELFRPELEAALARGDRSRGGRPPYDAVLMFRILVLQTLYTRSDDHTEYQLRDRLSFMHFAGLALHEPVPDAKTIWLFREQLTRAGALGRLFERFDAVLRELGYLAMGGQIVDATVVQARRPRLSKDEKQTVRDGGTPPGWSKARARHIDRDGRWTIKRGKKAPPSEGAERQALGEIAVPIFGYKNHIGIDRAHGFIRRFTVTHAARHDGSQLGAVLDPANTPSDVWADTAYRGQANLALLARRGMVAQFQRAKPRGKAMPAHIARGNATRARVRSRVEHVFAATKVRMGLVVRTIGLAPRDGKDHARQSRLQPHALRLVPGQDCDPLTPGRASPASAPTWSGTPIPIGARLRPPTHIQPTTNADATVQPAWVTRIRRRVSPILSTAQHCPLAAFSSSASDGIRSCAH